MPNNQQPKEIKIKAEDKDLKGAYSNLMQILHNKEEFVLDFFMITSVQGILSSRIVMSPGHIKRMVKALQENIAKYEERFGKIEEAAEPVSNFGFKPGEQQEKK